MTAETTAIEMINTADLSRYVQLSKEERELKERLKELQREKQPLEERLLDEIPNWPIQPPYPVDGMTVYIQEQIWARPKDPEDRSTAVLALKRAGLEDLVEETFNIHKLSAVIREWDRNGDPIPDELEEGIRIDRDYSLRCRKGS